MTDYLGNIISSSSGGLDQETQQLLNKITLDAETDTVTISSNLEVKGDSTTLETQQITSTDPILVLNENQLNSNAGLSIKQPSGQYANLLYTASDDFILSKNGLTEDALTTQANLTVNDLRLLNHTDGINQKISNSVNHISDNTNPHQVTKEQLGLGNVENIKTQTTTSDPVATNDSAQGYSVGSIWSNSVNQKSFICADSAVNNAEWKEITSVTEIFDSIPSPVKCFSSQRTVEVVEQLIENTIDDTSTSATTVWSSEKTSDEIKNSVPDTEFGLEFIKDIDISGQYSLNSFKAKDMIILGNYLFISSHDNGDPSFAKLHSFSIENPENPVYLDTIENITYLTRIWRMTLLGGKYILLVNNATPNQPSNGNPILVDVSNPSKMRIVESGGVPISIDPSIELGAVLIGRYLYCTRNSTNTIKQFNFDLLNNITERATITLETLPATISKLIPFGNYLLCIHEGTTANYGLLDLSDPNNIVDLGTQTILTGVGGAVTGFRSWGAYIQGTYLYCDGRGPGESVSQTDISDPENPVLIQKISHTFPERPNGSDIVGKYFYACFYNGLIKAYDATDGNLSLLSSIDIAGRQLEIIRGNGQYVYALDLPNGRLVIAKASKNYDQNLNTSSVNTFRINSVDVNCSNSLTVGGQLNIGRGLFVSSDSFVDGELGCDNFYSKNTVNSSMLRTNDICAIPDSNTRLRLCNTSGNAYIDLKPDNTVDIKGNLEVDGQLFCGVLRNVASIQSGSGGSICFDTGGATNSCFDGFGLTLYSGNSIRLLGGGFINADSLDTPAAGNLSIGTGTNTDDINLSKTGQTTNVLGNLTVSGNTILQGTVTQQNVQNVTISDPLIKLGDGNIANTLNLGLYGQFNDGTTKYTGLIRVPLDEEWVLAQSETEFTNTVATLDRTNLETLRVGNLAMGNGDAVDWSSQSKLATGSKDDFIITILPHNVTANQLLRFSSHSQIYRVASVINVNSFVITPPLVQDIAADSYETAPSAPASFVMYDDLGNLLHKINNQGDVVLNDVKQDTNKDCFAQLYRYVDNSFLATGTTGIFPGPMTGETVTAFNMIADVATATITVSHIGIYEIGYTVVNSVSDDNTLFKIGLAINDVVDGKSQCFIQKMKDRIGENSMTLLRQMDAGDTIKLYFDVGGNTVTLYNFNFYAERLDMND